MRTVWLVERMVGRLKEPYLIFDSQDSMLKHFTGATFDFIDTDVVEFSSYGIDYYATPWPVHEDVSHSIKKSWRGELGPNFID